MAKPKPSPSARNGANRRPMQDVSAAKQASQFPAVGMTLRSYKYDPSAKNKTRRGVVVKQGRWQRFKQKGALKKFAVIMAIVLLVSFGWLGKIKDELMSYSPVIQPTILAIMAVTLPTQSC
jgi:hypothetical protein